MALGHLLLRLQAVGLRERHGDAWLDVYQARAVRAESRGGWAQLRFAAREVMGGLVAAVRGRVGHGGPRAEGNNGEGMMGKMWTTFRSAVRGLVRAPGFALMAILILGTGIGSATTIFSAVNSVLLAPLPFDQPDRLVTVWERNPDKGWDRVVAAPANMHDWGERVEGFQAIAGYSAGLRGYAWMNDGRAELIEGVQVSGNIFEVLGVRMVHGAGMTSENDWVDRAGPAVVLSHDFWRERFGADPAVVGRTMQLDGVETPIVGVAPAGFVFPSAGAELWHSFAWAAGLGETAYFRRAHWMNTIARLSSGVDRERAQTELNAVALQLQEEHPELNREMYADIYPLRESLVGEQRVPLMILFGAVGLLLAVACVNVGNLQLVRAGSRMRELSVRRAIGASSRGIAGGILMESVILAGMGSAVGWFLARFAVARLTSLREVTVGGTPIEVDGTVAFFSIAVALVSALLFGAIPAWRASRGDVSDAMRTRSVGAGRARVASGFVTAQVALAMTLVLGAGLLVRSFNAMRSVDAGLDPEGVVTLSLSAPQASYPTVEAILGFWDDVLARSQALPGVEYAAVVQGLPLTGAGWTGDFVVEGWEEGRVGYELRHRESTPDYFRAMGIPLLRGRYFNDGDDLTGAPVALVNQAWVDEYSPDRDPVGRLFTNSATQNAEGPWIEIVGVVGNEHQINLTTPPAPEAWRPFHQDMGFSRRVVLKLAPGMSLSRAALEAVVAEVDPSVPIADFQPMTAVVENATRDAEFMVSLFGAFALIAVLLAAAGVYGVTAQTVRTRIPEFGIRLALGSAPSGLEWRALWKGLQPAGMGVVAGGLVGLVVAGSLRGQLFEVAPRDPLTFGGVALGLVTVALVSAWLPARRAGRLDPVRSLRAE